MKIFATLVVVALATQKSSANSMPGDGDGHHPLPHIPDYVTDFEEVEPTYNFTELDGPHIPDYVPGPEPPGDGDGHPDYVVSPTPHIPDYVTNWTEIEEPISSDVLELYAIPEPYQVVEGCDGADQCSSYEHAVNCKVVDTCLRNFFLRGQDSTHWDCEVMDGSCRDLRYACYSHDTMEECNMLSECFDEYNERFEHGKSGTVHTPGMEHYRDEFEVIESTGEIVYGVVDYTTATATMVYTLPRNEMSSPARDCYDQHGPQAVFHHGCCVTGAFTASGECDVVNSRISLSKLRCKPNNVYVNGACVAYECPETPGCNDPEPYCYYSSLHGKVLGICSN